MTASNFGFNRAHCTHCCSFEVCSGRWLVFRIECVFVVKIKSFSESVGEEELIIEGEVKVEVLFVAIFVVWTITEEEEEEDDEQWFEEVEQEEFRQLKILTPSFVLVEDTAEWPCCDENFILFLLNSDFCF